MVLLEGMIGAGKSAFARGIGASLRIDYWRGSPTFTLINEYDSEPRLVHVDLYRLSAQEVEELGLEEYASPDTILVVEWADRASSYLASFEIRHRYCVQLAVTGPGSRRVSVRHDPNGAASTAPSEQR